MHVYNILTYIVSYTYSYWSQAQQLVQASRVDCDPSAHEDEPKDLPVGISIQNLTKVYDEVS